MKVPLKRGMPGVSESDGKGKKTRPSQQSLTATRQKIQQAELNPTAARLGILVKNAIAA